jgi:cell division protein FtsL
MKNRWLHIFSAASLCLSLVLASAFASGCRNSKQTELHEMLDELDHQLDIRQSYDVPKVNRLVSLNQIAASKNISLEQLYALNETLIDEYKAYNFDSTKNCIARNIGIALKLDDGSKLDHSKIQLGFIYATSAHYLEAEGIFQTIDSSTLDPALKHELFTAEHRLSRELAEYSQDVDVKGKANADRAFYRSRLYSMLDPGGDEFVSLKVEEFMEKRDFSSADSLNRALISRTDPNTHDYAIYAYNQSLIEQELKDEDARLKWLILSAQADIKNSIKDYGSLTTISFILFDRQDLDHAFRYIQISMDDALFYNSRLRPWQIAYMLPKIEKAYQNRQARQQQQITVFLIIISALLLLALTMAVFLVKRSRKLSKTQRELKEMNRRIVDNNTQLSSMNAQLSEMNRQVTEADTIKEQYIALFLNLLSDNIEKMKAYRSDVRKKLTLGEIDRLKADLNKANMMDDEISDFYHTFDTAFLSLYPNFVDEFNALLTDEGKIQLKKGELLNTELRIFALIRLGITDSGKIATLLRYSVNTIYNYRAKVKNYALDSREDFEESVKRIEAFQS